MHECASRHALAPSKRAPEFRYFLGRNCRMMAAPAHFLRWVDAHPSDRDVAPRNLAGSQPIFLGRGWDVRSTTGMPCPYRRVRRAAPAPRALLAHAVLQWRPHTSISDQGRAGTACCSGQRAHSADANSWRIAPSVCSDLISDRDKDRTRRNLAGSRFLTAFLFELEFA